MQKKIKINSNFGHWSRQEFDFPIFFNLVWIRDTCHDYIMYFCIERFELIIFGVFSVYGYESEIRKKVNEILSVIISKSWDGNENSWAAASQLQARYRLVVHVQRSTGRGQDFFGGCKRAIVKSIYVRTLAWEATKVTHLASLWPAKRLCQVRQREVL